MDHRWLMNSNALQRLRKPTVGTAPWTSLEVITWWRWSRLCFHSRGQVYAKSHQGAPGDETPSGDSEDIVCGYWYNGIGTLVQYLLSLNYFKVVKKVYDMLSAFLGPLKITVRKSWCRSIGVWLSHIWSAVVVIPLQEWCGCFGKGAEEVYQNAGLMWMAEESAWMWWAEGLVPVLYNSVTP